MNSTLANGTWTIELGGRSLTLHSPEQPFATAVRREKSYETNRGTVKETVVEKERIPLTEIRQPEDAADVLLLSGGGRQLGLTLSEPEPGMIAAGFSGEDGWGYEIDLPAVPG
ncbi:MAG: hypothetical protein IKI82_03335, partial [Lachnospiraceae bacterium]|nr:hypothetical protein [Lachnospiraceae bacterium]